ncbi:hypothetical protein ACFSCW_05630 [Sphingomonas tabacisoli]|uniref:Uncharacterized protein n=1 Tax=Sphingomonas tabacisoli TaxID=2249466 RepID=A0ABW4I1H3_9SPHN
MLYFLLLTAVAHHPPMIPTFGFGSVKCEAAFKPDSVMQAQSWILGFWTGLNVQSGHGVGTGKSNDDIWDSVRKACAKTPSATLLAATQTAYKALKG